ncbi:UDP-N-acetylmuramoyl-tripeptide--D-alanyl-D-alanine ligase [Neobacillus sp. SAB-20_R2A]|uniref:UDP-N-acetylmuramoyl-tripeptide--D-alanyl-D- alanine ligase n=1 Tax=Neobacillus sp. SAB-20_R2A TaxID=3120519 RepID=UPI003C6E4C55
MYPLRLPIPMIAVTGSAGKTTTKEMIASILATKWKIFKSKKNRNQRYHTQRHASLIKPSHQAAVLEYGMGRKRSGKIHCSFIEPNIGIITNVGAAHFGVLGNSVKKIAKSKSALIKYMKQDGLLFLNGDDENSKLLETRNFQGEIITIGIQNDCNYKANNIKFLPNGMSFEVQLDGHPEEFMIPFFGVHNVMNALFAIAVAHRLHFTPSDIKTGLERAPVPLHRLNMIELSNHSLLIDDSFSSNPPAAKAAIDVLNKIAETKKKIVLLGTMLELGAYSMEGHKEVGRYLAGKGIEIILTFGEEAKWIGDGATEAGYAKEKIYHFDDREQLHQFLDNTLTHNSAILIKGSNKMNMSLTSQYLNEKYGKQP